MLKIRPGGRSRATTASVRSCNRAILLSEPNPYFVVAERVKHSSG
jgi:hypothetical protein